MIILIIKKKIIKINNFKFIFEDKIKTLVNA
nr:MAG TPA: hypothetical protein [Caudoviricetes sp.]